MVSLYSLQNQSLASTSRGILCELFIMMSKSLVVGAGKSGQSKVTGPNGRPLAVRLQSVKKVNGASSVIDCSSQTENSIPLTESIMLAHISPR